VVACLHKQSTVALPSRVRMQLWITMSSGPGFRRCTVGCGWVVGGGGREVGFGFGVHAAANRRKSMVLNPSAQCRHRFFPGFARLCFASRLDRENFSRGLSSEILPVPISCLNAIARLILPTMLPAFPENPSASFSSVMPKSSRGHRLDLV
jgi:hypothetical protein